MTDIDYTNETKREKFLRLAENRTNGVISKIRTLAKCSNPYAYEYTDDDVNQIFSAIEEELKIAKSQFRTPVNRGRFELNPNGHDNR